MGVVWFSLSYPVPWLQTKRWKLVPGHLLEMLTLTFFYEVTLDQSSVKAEAVPPKCHHLAAAATPKLTPRGKQTV